MLLQLKELSVYWRDWELYSFEFSDKNFLLWTSSPSTRADANFTIKPIPSSQFPRLNMLSSASKTPSYGDDFSGLNHP